MLPIRLPEWELVIDRSPMAGGAVSTAKVDLGKDGRLWLRVTAIPGGRAGSSAPYLLSLRSLEPSLPEPYWSATACRLCLSCFRLPGRPSSACADDTPSVAGIIGRMSRMRKGS